MNEMPKIDEMLKHRFVVGLYNHDTWQCWPMKAADNWLWAHVLSEWIGWCEFWSAIWQRRVPNVSFIARKGPSPTPEAVR